MADIKLGRFRGGYCVYWTDSKTEKRVRRGLKSVELAAAQAEAVETYRLSTLTDKPRLPIISELMSQYIMDLGDKPTAQTMRYTSKAILSWFGHYQAEMITKPICQGYSEHRMKVDGVSQGTVHTELGHLQSTINWAVKNRKILAQIPIWRPAKPETDKRILSRAEALLLVDSAQAPHIRLALILMLSTAARVSAILDLTWDRVVFENNNINLRLPDMVTRKGRANVAMNQWVRGALETAWEARTCDSVVEHSGSSISSIRTGFQTALKIAGIGHLRIHDIRHTAAVTMLSQGVPIEKVAQYLGHSNIAVTYKVYGRYLPSHLQDAADILDFSIDPSESPKLRLVEK